MKRFIKIFTLAVALTVALTSESMAQHTIALTGGSGFATSRPYPAQEMRPIWGTYQVGFSWRYYSMPRFLACFGIDVELLQRGYSFAPYPSKYEDKKEYKYYTRTVNSIMIPIVWQPHIYLFKRHLRVYLEAAPTFSFNFSSKFYNEETHIYAMTEDGIAIPYEAIPKDKYTFRPERDNRFTYEFGHSDILRNRRKYYSKNLDGVEKPGENPFMLTPLRSPLDNLTMSVKIGFRIGKAGFKEWDWKRPNYPKYKEEFKYAL